MMFENYTLGVQSSNACNCNTHPSVDIVPTVEDYSIEDKYGNIVKLSWSPSARFTINLTSDMKVPVALGSKVLSAEGATPYGIPGTEGLVAYNTNDCKCWKYTSGKWSEEPDIIEVSNSSTVIVFSTKNCTTTVSVKNFRGESILSVSNNSNIVSLQVDDTVASMLLQGFYNVDIYKTYDNETKLVRRIPLSIGYTQQSSSNNPHGHHPTTGFTTDNSLIFENGVLSVNTIDGCYVGSTLPVSSEAVYNFAQPRNIIVQVDSTNNYSSINSIDVYNHIVSGGNVLCVLDNDYYDFDSGSADLVRFKRIDIEENSITSKTIEIDSSHNSIVSIYSTSFNSSSSDADDIHTEISNLSSRHDADITSINSLIDDMSSAIDGIKSQVGNIDVQARFNLLVTQLNEQTDRLNAIDNDTKVNYNEIQELRTHIDELQVNLDEVVTKEDVSDIVEEAIDDDKLHDIVSNIISTSAVFDGGVIE